MKNLKEIRQRLEELRTELRSESISYEELMELQSLAAHIDAGDVELLEAAGVPEQNETNETVNFMFWAMNRCVPLIREERLDWFNEVFGGYHIGRHLFEKWESEIGRFKTSSSKMLLWFFFQLSEDNQEKLVNWVSNNYTK